MFNIDSGIQVTVVVFFSNWTIYVAACVCTYPSWEIARKKNELTLNFEDFFYRPKLLLSLASYKLTK